MIKLIIVPMLAFFFYPQSLLANKYTLKQCNIISNHLNKEVPKVIDKATTLTSTVCTYGPVFTYNYSVLNSINFIPNSFVKKLRTQWCTNPQFADLINGFEKIEFVYYKKNGEFIKTIIVAKEYC